MIHITDIKKSYGKNQVLLGVSHQFNAGTIVGVVGKNGAGKTTLFNCMAGLEVYDGSVTSPFVPLKNVLGYLQTHPMMMSWMTGWEYLRLMCIARGIQRKDFKEINYFDLPLDQYASSYSTGMKKKLALQAIMLQDNEVFILDEPFNGVDIYSNTIIIDWIKRMKMAGKTIILSSHILMTLRSLCDEILWIDKGRFKHFTPSTFENLETEMLEEFKGG